MAGFINHVLKDLQAQSINISNTTFILPSKRAGLFLKQEISKLTNQTTLVPSILSIEDFIETLSQLRSINQTELLFHFYESYIIVNDSERIDDFEKFCKWGTVLLQDFNEIDRYLVPSAKIFDHLSAVKKIDAWLLDSERTELISNYLMFWSNLLELYSQFTKSLKQNGVAYQGLIYREAVEHLESYVQNHQNKFHVFVGFNALNKAESIVIQELLNSGTAKIYWDYDAHYVLDPIHEAGHFARAYKRTWKIFRNRQLDWIESLYKDPKLINSYGAVKNVGQAKTVAHILSQLSHEELQKTALVLADEQLLIPILNSIPQHINKINITMGFPMSLLPVSSLLNTLLTAHKRQSKSFNHKSIKEIITHQLIQPLLNHNGSNTTSAVIKELQKNNITYLNLPELKKYMPKNSRLLDLLFGNWQKSVHYMFDIIGALILELKHFYDEDKLKNALVLEQLYRTNTILNVLKDLNNRFGHLKSIQNAVELFKQTLNSETLDFEGEPLEGLQVMGMLESRLLDFDTVILTSVNEGVLPAGKQNYSFLPFDVKLEHGLPTFKDKDAIYAYHFYRLVQRANTIHLVYNTEPDVLNGGEKSRFITQMEVEQIHKIKHHAVSSHIPKTSKAIQQIYKTPDIISKIEGHFNNGLSPSALLKYIRNPIDYYYRYVLGVDEEDGVEEFVAANTLGTVVHESLRLLYEPLEGKSLTQDRLKPVLEKVDTVILDQFNSVYKKGDISSGKNLIIYEIAKRYVSNFITNEIALLQKGHRLQLVSVEKTYEVLLRLDAITFDIKLRGQIDRIDVFDGQPRIIDFKTGNVIQSDVEIVNWESIITDYTKNSKAFQVLFYSLLLEKDQNIKLPYEAGVISFKNLKAGFLKFSKKDKIGRGANKETLVNSEVINAFREQLEHLIIEILNPDKPFVAKELN